MSRTRPPSSWRRRARQAGFTLIELMVAITVTLFMLAGVLAIYVNMKTTFVAQSNLAQLQDSERLVLTMLTTTLQSAGYFVNPLTNTATSALPAASVTWPGGTTSAFAAGQAVVGTGSGTGTGAASDTIAVQYQAASGDGLMNCQGGTNPATSGAPVVWVNSFAVNNNNELTCTVGTGAPVALASQVASLSVLYGVDTSGSGATDTYLPASGVTAAGLWSSVHTAQVTVTFLNTVSAAGGNGPSIVQTINFMNKP